MARHSENGWTASAASVGGFIRVRVADRETGSELTELLAGRALSAALRHADARWWVEIHAGCAAQASLIGVLAALDDWLVDRAPCAVLISVDGRHYIMEA
jgi:hypothetical protein